MHPDLIGQNATLITRDRIARAILEAERRPAYSSSRDRRRMGRSRFRAVVTVLSARFTRSALTDGADSTAAR